MLTVTTDASWGSGIELLEPGAHQPHTTPKRMQKKPCALSPLILISPLLSLIHLGYEDSVFSAIKWCATGDCNLQQRLDELCNSFNRSKRLGGPCAGLQVRVLF